MSTYARYEKKAAAPVPVSLDAICDEMDEEELEEQRGASSFSAARVAEIDFIGFVQREIKYKGQKSNAHMYSVVPVGVHQLLQEGAPSMVQFGNGIASKPTYEPATANGEALRLNAWIELVPQVGTKAKKRVYHPLDHVKDPNVGLVANYREFAASVMVFDTSKEDKDKDKEEKKKPERVVHVPNEWSLVMVKGYCIKWIVPKDTSKKPYLGATVADLDPTPFADFNALPEVTRIALAYAVNNQHWPELAPLTRFSGELRIQTAHITGAKKDVTKAKEELLKEWIPPLPSILVQANRALNSFHVFVPASHDLPLVLPMRGYPAEQPARLTDTVLLSLGDDVEHEKGIYANFDFEATTMVNDQTAESYRVRAVAFADKLVGAGACFPYLLKPLMEHHPIPFMFLGGVNLVDTVENDKNRIHGANKYSPDGVIALNAFSDMHWRLREYLERRAIPVTRDLVNKRYGGNGMANFEVPNPTGLRALGAGKVFTSPYQGVGALNTKGLIALDSDQIVKLPLVATGTRYYALWLTQLLEELPLASRADPLCAQPLGMQPPAVDLTPEQGDAFVLRTLGPDAKDVLNADDSDPDLAARKVHMWLATDADHPRPVPKFLFFAMSPAAHTPADAQLVPLPVAAPWTEQKQQQLAHLPADMNALRRQLIEAKLALLEAPVAPATPAEGKKREREEKEGEQQQAHEPPTKRAHVDETA